MKADVLPVSPPEEGTETEGLCHVEKVENLTRFFPRRSISL